jgi:uncharacterized repeat protein (TIGR03803 family)
MLSHRVKCCPSVRRIIGPLFAFGLALVLLGSVSQLAQSQTFNVIYNFTDVNAGVNPYGGPTLDRVGNLYGTTYLGGQTGNGTVYKLSHSGSSWTYTTLYSFQGSDGAGPGFGSLTFGPDGRPYGTAEGGGPFFIGVAFSVQPPAHACLTGNCSWTDSILHNFGNGNDGAQPFNGVTFDAAGNFYGTTNLGGPGGLDGNGTVFEATRSGQTWTESVIYNFAGGTDAGNPVAGVSIDAAGNLYGTSSFGGAYANGAVYKLSRSGSSWTETVIYSFQGASDGAAPVGGVIPDQAGNLYGTTFFGGDNGGGTVYELSPSSGSWTLTTLYSFSGFSAGPYNDLTFDANGNLYGATEGDGAFSKGSVFKLTHGDGGWTFTDLYDFTGGNDGGVPYGRLAVDSHGNIFGTTSIGGTGNQGVVFEVSQ